MLRLKTVLVAFLVAILLAGPGPLAFASSPEGQPCPGEVADMAAHAHADHDALDAVSEDHRHGVPKDHRAGDSCCHAFSCSIGLPATEGNALVLGRDLAHPDEPGMAMTAGPGDLPFKPPRLV